MALVLVALVLAWLAVAEEEEDLCMLHFEEGLVELFELAVAVAQLEEAFAEAPVEEGLAEEVLVEGVPVMVAYCRKPVCSVHSVLPKRRESY